MGPKNYRLGEHRIIESATGELRWEAHRGFTDFHEGTCFRKGAILFLGPAENEQAGFLKGDFLDHIKVFPVWSKTRYYCSASDLYDCETGKRVAKQEMMMWILDLGMGKGKSAPRKGTFRLGRYEIARTKTGQIVWKTAPGPNTLCHGTCTVLEDILFIEPGKTTESDSIGRMFATNLQQLPKWDQTGYYCPKSSLCDCISSNSVHERRTTRPSARRATGKHDDVGKVGKWIRFMPTELDTWRRQTVIFFRWVKPFVISFFRALGVIISFSFACLIRFCKEIRRRCHFKKGERPSVHRH